MLMIYISSWITIHTYTLFLRSVYRYVGLAWADFLFGLDSTTINTISFVFMFSYHFYLVTEIQFTSSPKQQHNEFPYRKLKHNFSTGFTFQTFDFCRYKIIWDTSRQCFTVIDVILGNAWLVCCQSLPHLR